MERGAGIPTAGTLLKLLTTAVTGLDQNWELGDSAQVSQVEGRDPITCAIPCCLPWCTTVGNWQQVWDLTQISALQLVMGISQVVAY